MTTSTMTMCHMIGEIPEISYDNAIERQVRCLLKSKDIDPDLASCMMKVYRAPECRIPRRLITDREYNGNIVTEIGGVPLTDDELYDTCCCHPCACCGTLDDYVQTRKRYKGRIVLYTTPQGRFRDLFEKQTETVSGEPRCLKMKDRFTCGMSKGMSCRNLGINIVDATGREFIFVSPHESCCITKLLTLVVHVNQIVTKEAATTFALQSKTN
jgi:hypothetical protein